MDGQKDRKMGGQTDGWTDRWMDRQMGGQTDGQTDGWTGRQKDRQMDGHTDRWMDVQTDITMTLSWQRNMWLTFVYVDSTTPPFLGNVCNPSDNVEDVFDTALFNFTVAIPDHTSGSSFLMAALLTFNNTVEMVDIEVLTEEYFIVVPRIVISTAASDM